MEISENPRTFTIEITEEERLHLIYILSTRSTGSIGEKMLKCLEGMNIL